MVAPTATPAIALLLRPSSVAVFMDADEEVAAEVESRRERADEEAAIEVTLNSVGTGAIEVVAPVLPFAETIISNTVKPISRRSWLWMSRTDHNLNN